MKNKYAYVFLFLTLSVSFVGCFREVLHDTASLKNSTNIDINVVTKDSSRYYFESGSYIISRDTINKEAIYGHAKKYRRIEQPFTRFEGSIPLDDVEKIYSSENTPFFYISIGVATVSVGLLIWMAVAFSNFGTGG